VSVPSSPPPDAPPPSLPLTLTERERALLGPEVAAVAGSIAEPSLRTAYEALLAGVEQGEVPPASLDRLENLLEMGLQTGRFRRQQGPIDTQVLYRLYGRTPRGAALARALTGVNDALAGLAGQAIEGLALSAKGPGEYELAVETDQCRMAVVIGAGGVHLSSIEFGV
jgi:hypothetical protein